MANVSPAPSGSSGSAMRDLPWPPLRVGPKCPALAHVDEAPLDAAGAQHGDHPVGDETLGRPVQRQPRALPESDAVPVKGDVLEADFGKRRLDGFALRPLRAGARRREMVAIEVPQHLHRRIEYAPGDRPEPAAFLQQVHELRGRANQHAVAVQGDEGRVVAIKAEDPLEPTHFREAPLQELFGRGAVAMVDLQARQRTHGRPAPGDEMGFGRRCRGEREQA